MFPEGNRQIEIPSAAPVGRPGQSGDGASADQFVACPCKDGRNGPVEIDPDPSGRTVLGLPPPCDHTRPLSFQHDPFFTALYLLAAIELVEVAAGEPVRRPGGLGMSVVTAGLPAHERRVRELGDPGPIQHLLQEGAQIDLLGVDGL